MEDRTQIAASARPILKWVGGKGRLLEKLMARMPPVWGEGRYFEPFAGGAALLFHLRPRRAILSDQNADLINVYRCVAWHLETVTRHLARHRRLHSEEHYYKVRESWNRRSANQTNASRAAQFIYMNKTCFNGLYRVNGKGEFNVPMGRYKNPNIYDLAGLRSASAVLRNVELYRANYRDAVIDAESGDFVYFDPPYHPLTSTANFASYTSSGFGEDDQRELADVANGLASKGCSVLLSNSDTPLIRDIYKGWGIDRVMCGRSISSKSTERGSVAEVIIYSRQ